MLVRLFFDAGRLWKTFYFSNVPVEQVNKIKSAFKFNSMPRCWDDVLVSEQDGMLEIRVGFRSNVRFDCLGASGDNADAWYKKASEMNKEIMHQPRKQMLQCMLDNEAYAKMDCCTQNFKSGKCTNPFVVTNLGGVLLPHLYPTVKQK